MTRLYAQPVSHGQRHLLHWFCYVRRDLRVYSHLDYTRKFIWVVLKITASLAIGYMTAPIISGN